MRKKVIVKFTCVLFALAGFLYFNSFNSNTAMFNARSYSCLRPRSIFNQSKKNIKVKKASDSVQINPYLLFEYKKEPVILDKNTIVLGTGGGDVALNTFLADVAEKAHTRGLRAVGVRNCYDGMVSDNWRDNLVEITPELAKAMRGMPSTVLGSCRRKLSDDDLKIMVERFGNVKGMVITGGNDHIKGVEQISDVSNNTIRAIGVGKSIDNDFRTAMFGYRNACILGQRIAKWLSVNPETHKNVVSVVEVMGRKSGSFALDCARGCPYPKVVIAPEQPVKMSDIIKAVKESGTRNIYISEGVSFSAEEDEMFRELLEKNPHLAERYATLQKNPQRDAHGNVLLRGVFLYAAGAIELFCKDLKVERGAITYPARGASPQKETDGVEDFYFDDYLADVFSEKALELIKEGKTGLALYYPDYKRGHKVEAKPCKEVYAEKNLKDIYIDKELAELGVLGMEGVKFLPGKDAIRTYSGEYTKEGAARELFYSQAISTRTHSSLLSASKHLLSSAEFDLPSKIMVSACGRKQPGIENYPDELRTIIETTRESVMILIPEKYVSFGELANSIENISDNLGYVNIAVSSDFMLDKTDPILKEVLDRDDALRAKFNTEAIDIGDDKVIFNYDVSKFIRGLFDYLGKKTRRMNFNYIFDNLEQETKDLSLPNDRELAQNGVLGTGIKSELNITGDPAASSI